MISRLPRICALAISCLLLLINLNWNTSRSPLEWADNARAHDFQDISPPLNGPPPLPYSPYGTVLVGGIAVPIGTEVTAWCGGVQFAQTETILDEEESWYSIDVPGDVSGTTEIEGCVAGEIVSFYIGELIADQTAPWQSGVSELLDLTVPPTTIVVVKETIGGDGNFEFTSSTLSPSPFYLNTSGGTASIDFIELVPGTYDVAETDPGSEWDMTDSYCDDDSDPDAIGLDRGETVTCTFVNTRRGKIVVVKETIGGTGTFEFTSLTLSPSPFYLNTEVTNPASTEFIDLEPGTYDVAETVPAEWDMTSATCSDGSEPVAILLAPGEIVTCTFVNTTTILEVYLPIIMR